MKIIHTTQTINEGMNENWNKTLGENIYRCLIFNQTFRLSIGNDYLDVFQNFQKFLEY